MTPGHVKRSALTIVAHHRGQDGRASAAGVRLAARCAQVSERQVWRWVADNPEAVAGGAVDTVTVPEQRRAGWVPTAEVLALIAGSETLKEAHKAALLRDPTTPSYQRFTAVLREQEDAGLIAGLRDGAGALLAKRLYMQVVVPDRNQRWELDAQEVPVYCLPRRGTTSIKLWQTTAIDAATRMVMGTVFTPGPPNAQDVAACVALGVRGRRYLQDDGTEVFVGGIPEVIAWDNAKANLSELVTLLMASLRSLGVPVTPFAGWEKGRIESWHDTSQAECYSTMPGYSDGPASFTGKRYWGGYDSPNLLLHDLVMLQGSRWAYEYYNTERPHSSLDGLTPLQAWTDDTTPLRTATRDQLLPAMLSAPRVSTLNKDGFRFNKVNYVPLDGTLNGDVRRKFRLRYLPDLDPEELHVEVFDLNDNWLCTAYPSSRLTPEQRARHLTERQQQYRRFSAAQKEGARMRRRRADAVEASNGTQTTYGRPLGEFAGDPLAANVDELFGPGATGNPPGEGVTS